MCTPVLWCSVQVASEADAGGDGCSLKVHGDINAAMYGLLDSVLTIQGRKFTKRAKKIHLGLAVNSLKLLALVSKWMANDNADDEERAKIEVHHRDDAHDPSQKGQSLFACLRAVAACFCAVHMLRPCARVVACAPARVPCARPSSVCHGLG